MPGNMALLWTVIAMYMAIVISAGIYYSRFVKTADAYFRAENSVPWWAAGIAIYKANFTAYTFVAIASLVYVDGLSGLLLETGPALAFLVAAVVFANRWRRLDITSPPEYLETRFNPATRRVFSVLGIATTFLASGMRLYAVSKLVEAILGLPLLWVICVAGSVMVLYTVLGGLSAVVVTDVLQFLILFLAVVPMLFTSVAHVFTEGGLAHFISLIPPGYGSFPHLEHDRTLGWLLAFWFSYLLDYNGDWGVIQMMCATPSEKDSRRAAFLAMALGIPHAFLLLGPCFIARVLWAKEVADPSVMAQAETVYWRIALKLLPTGMIGVVAAAMLAATMSTLTVAWNVRATSFVNDIYSRFLRPRASDKEKILAGRLAVIAIGGTATSVAAYIAVRSSGLFALAQGVIGFVVIPLILPLLCGLLIRRLNPWSALAGFGASLLFAMTNEWTPWLYGRQAPMPFERQIVFGVLFGLAGMLVCAQLPQDAEYSRQVERLFRKMSQPSRPREGDLTLPAPMGILSVLTGAVSLLVMLLALTPQKVADRLLTVGEGVALGGIALLMRRAGRRFEAATAREAKVSVTAATADTRRS